MHKVGRSINGVYDECWFGGDDNTGLVTFFADEFECRVLACQSLEDEFLDGFVRLRDDIGGCEMLTIYALETW